MWREQFTHNGVEADGGRGKARVFPLQEDVRLRAHAADMQHGQTVLSIETNEIKRDLIGKDVK